MKSTAPKSSKVESPPAVKPKPNPLHAMHTFVIGHYVYTNQLQDGIANNMGETAFTYITETVAGMKPRDPFEEMLLIQSLWTHARLARLSILANQQTSIKSLKVVNDACDQAANTFRRQMLALAEYRRPPRSESFTAIKQANIAQQQVVQNVPNQISKTEEPTNEKGLPAHNPAGLPAVSGGPSIASTNNWPIQAMAEHDRAADSRGEGSLKNERDKTRRT